MKLEVYRTAAAPACRCPRLQQTVRQLTRTADKQGQQTATVTRGYTRNRYTIQLCAVPPLSDRF
ncbi:hypothetical protein [Paenibacillus senegalensis]|uniref:hypothetical protein n=1 Tax=Paenibacillus senegalensis TaxID=1465766 RepID=UPI0011DDDC50|nr:hypothetical protein [Paenibacillus senegalensis]